MVFIIRMNSMFEKHYWCGKIENYANNFKVKKRGKNGHHTHIIKQTKNWN